MDDVALGADASTDGELLERTRAGDREAFGVLYERRHEPVLAFLLKRTHDPEVAMDLMADQFEALRARVLDERGYEDIARQLECSTAVVRKRVSRAISTLRQARQAST
jgi:DNA-directed RNA polymerase specialized sigma24 family protein